MLNKILYSLNIDVRINSEGYKFFMAIHDWTHKCKDCGATRARPFEISIQKCLRCYGEMLPTEAHAIQFAKQRKNAEKRNNYDLTKKQ